MDEQAPQLLTKAIEHTFGRSEPALRARALETARALGFDVTVPPALT